MRQPRGLNLSWENIMTPPCLSAKKFLFISVHLLMWWLIYLRSSTCLQRSVSKRCTLTLTKVSSPGVSNESLWEKRKRKRPKKDPVRRVKKQHARRTSIEKRPKPVENREEFGHWELDLIVGEKRTTKPVLMTLVERKTRMLRVRKLPDKTQASVFQALKAMERSMGVCPFRSMFKSITADNGSEFLDVEQMERSGFSKKRRVKLYYAHPYSSWERGSSENGNRIIRRFITKGHDIGKWTLKRIGEIEKWINNYPRKILAYKTAQEFFDLEMAA
ncbi:MAG: IS30 family transposase [Kiritimatiellae bacterium]|nr:IS30 family transposase [Kiritimatiellia bacterium]